jgi:hypothetical protein
MTPISVTGVNLSSEQHRKMIQSAKQVRVTKR